MAVDDYTQMWYLAECQECVPVLPVPFSTVTARDNWAHEHTDATGHSVVFRETPRSIQVSYETDQPTPSGGIDAARQALADNPLAPEQVSDFIQAHYAESAADHERAFEWYLRDGE
jgi:hypothetical protein